MSWEWVGFPRLGDCRVNRNIKKLENPNIQACYPKRLCIYFMWFMDVLGSYGIGKNINLNQKLFWTVQQSIMYLYILRDFQKGHRNIKNHRFLYYGFDKFKQTLFLKIVRGPQDPTNTIEHISCWQLLQIKSICNVNFR